MRTTARCEGRRQSKFRRVLLTVPASLLLVAAAALTAASQEATAVAPSEAQAGVVRGTITAKLTGSPLSHAVVTIAALDLQQFSNEQGKFYFVKLKPGTYQLNVRQLGYLPANTEIVVDATGTAAVTIQMDRIATKLSTFKVTDQQLCELPGRPTQADGEQLVQVFEQLEQSAIRLGLMARQYPHQVFLERRFMRREVSGTDVPERRDVFSREGQRKAQYQPGQVVKRMGGGTYSLQIPTLLDFTDAKFIANHCFALRGLEVLPEEAGLDSAPMIRIDFTASNALKNPDVEGSVFLDSADFRLRRTVIRLSKIPNNMPEIATVSVTTTFQDYVPGMPIVGFLQGVTEMKEANGKPLRIQSRTEQQIVTHLVFQKDRPDSAPRPPK